MDGDGSPDWGLCLDLKPPCKSNYLLMGIASSLIQSTRTLQVWIPKHDLRGAAFQLPPTLKGHTLANYGSRDSPFRAPILIQVH